MHKEAGHQVESAVEARAGFLDRPVLVVLCVSTIVVALMLGGIWIGMAFLGGGGVQGAFTGVIPLPRWNRGEETAETKPG